MELKHYTELDEGMVNIANPPRFDGLMTGASYAMQDNRGDVTIVYEDGTKESAPVKYDICKALDSGHPFHGIVASVQGQRPNTKCEGFTPYD
jgi:hypothetical protein